MSETYRRNLLLLFGLAGILLAAGLGLRDPWPADEPRFALIARDIAENGEWLFPRVGGVLYPDKPPFFFWLVATIYGVFDSLRVAFLLPALLSGLAVLALVTDLARRLWDEDTALWCGATLMALVQFPLQMKSGQIDALLCVWTTLGFVGFARHLLLGPDWRWYTIGGVAAGLGIITKGVGFLPYFVLIPYAWAARAGWNVPRYGWRNWRWLLAPVATIGVVGSWLLPMLTIVSASGDPDLAAYRDNILFHQTVTRYADSWAHFRPPWYLLTNAAPWLWLPVTIFLPWLLPHWRRDLARRDAATLLAGGWIILILLFFSLTAGKRSLYILPAVPALALIAGRSARSVLDRVGPQRILVLLPAAIGCALIVAGMFALMHPHDPVLRGADAASVVMGGSAGILVGLGMLAIAAIARRRRALAGFAAAMSMFWIGTGLLVAPSIDAERSGRALIESAKRNLAPGSQVGFAFWPEQFLLQWTGPVSHFGYRRNDPQAELYDAIRWVMQAPERRLLLPQSMATNCFDATRVVPVGSAHRRDWILSGADSVKLVCAAAANEKPELVYNYWAHGTRQDVVRLGATPTSAQVGMSSY